MTDTYSDGTPVLMVQENDPHDPLFGDAVLERKLAERDATILSLTRKLEELEKGKWPTPCETQEQADAMLAITVYGTGSEFEAIQAKELKSMKGVTDRINDELQEARAENDRLRDICQRLCDFGGPCHELDKEQWEAAEAEARLILQPLPSPPQIMEEGK
jgi:hypothetical protein